MKNKDGCERCHCDLNGYQGRSGDNKSGLCDSCLEKTQQLDAVGRAIEFCKWSHSMLVISVNKQMAKTALDIATQLIKAFGRSGE